MNIVNGQLEGDINFTPENISNWKEKTIEYFLEYGFKLVSTDNDRVILKHSTHFFSAWTFNPLNWKSEFEIKMDDLNIRVHYRLDNSTEFSGK